MLNSAWETERRGTQQGLKKPEECTLDDKFDRVGARAMNQQL